MVLVCVENGLKPLLDTRKIARGLVVSNFTVQGISTDFPYFIDFLPHFVRSI